MSKVKTVTYELDQKDTEAMFNHYTGELFFIIRKLSVKDDFEYYGERLEEIHEILEKLNLLHNSYPYTKKAS